MLVRRLLLLMMFAILGSINLGRIDSLQELARVVELGTKFLICGTLRAELPYAKVHEVRAKTGRLGLGLMGMHELVS